MSSLKDSYKLDQASKWRNILNDRYNINLGISDVHDIFQKLGVFSKEKNFDDANIKFYDKDKIENLISNGEIKREIDTLLNNRKKYSGLRKLPVSYSTPPKEGPEKILKRGRRNFILQNKPIEKNTDDLDIEYNNGENDMEAYSNYLINNVYQFEGKQKKRIFVTEKQLKDFLKELI